MRKNTKKITAFGITAIFAVAGFASLSSVSAGAVTCSTSPCTTSIPVSVTVSDTISLSVAAGSEVSVSLGPNDTWPSAAHTTPATTTLSVATNALAGWTLSVADQDTDNSLKNGNVASIVAGSTTTGFNLTAGTPAWGIRGVTSGTSTGVTWGSKMSTSTFIGVPALASAINWSTAFVPSTGNSVVYTNEIGTKIGTTPLTVSSHSNLSTAVTDDRTVVEYGVATAGNQIAGTYTDTVVYMATVNV